MDAFLGTATEGETPRILYQLQYEQLSGPASLREEGLVTTFPASPLSLALDDSTLEPVHTAWKKVMGDAAVEGEYMVFADREGALDDDDDNV